MDSSLHSTTVSAAGGGALTSFTADLLAEAQQTACSLGLDLPVDFWPQVQALYQHLLEANQRVNLTRITDARGFLFRHVLDSLLLLPELPAGVRLMDVGSGAGFPSIPLALARPDLQVVAVESIGKKAAFIEACRHALGLENRLTVLNQRSEVLARDPAWRDAVPVVTARAVARLPQLLEFCLPLVAPQGVFLAMKGASAEAEVTEAAKALQALRGRVEGVMRPVQPPDLAESAVIRIRKTAATPQAYPRLGKKGW